MSRLPGLGPRGEGWLVLQVLLMAAIVGAGLYFEPALVGLQRLAATLAGIGLIGGGIGLVALAARQLGTAATPLPRPETGASLIADGLYARIRHPVYVGVVLSALGWALLTASLPSVILVGALVVLLDLKARREESWLRERYPAYEEYARRTRRFIPGLY